MKTATFISDYVHFIITDTVDIVVTQQMNYISVIQYLE